ncbi:type II toxin-antitoxin system HigA family antitoxin [Chloroflexota bacterium]
MLSDTLEKAVQAWPLLTDVLFVPHTEAEYERAVVLLDELIDEVGEDETHPLASLMETLGSLIEVYEANHLPEPVGNPLSTLREFMNDHALSVNDLPEIGDHHVVSEILKGRRELTLPQIQLLGKRFHVSPAVFL